MPEPITRGERYMPGLDGLRAIAVLAVICFHLGFGWAPGGLLGVGIFFTLSGYLITDILLGQFNRRGMIHLGRFWLGRARRLLPALFLMLLIVIAWVTIFGPAQPDQFRKSVVSAIFYINNWQQIAANVSYFARFAPEQPLNHLWSLSVEEQFYILWPFILLIGLKVFRDRQGNGLRPHLAIATLVMAIISSILMAVLYHPSLDPSRVYYGTDTRAAGLLFGAALAMVWPSRRLSRRITPQARKTLDGVGVLGLLIIAIMIWRTGEFSQFLYRGGFVVLSLATVMVLMPLAHPACRLGKIVGAKPLRWIGVRSYGIYLWQTPVIVLTSPQHPFHHTLLRDALQVAAIFIIAALSWKFVEEPIRHGAIGRLLARRRRVGWSWATFSPEGRVVLVSLGVLLIVAVAGLAFGRWLLFRLIVAGSGFVVSALLQEACTLPIVFVTSVNPVANGFVSALQRPGGNLTGFTNSIPSMGGKWLELLKQVAPSVARVSIMYNPDKAGAHNISFFLPQVEAVAASIAVEPVARPVRSPAEIGSVFADLGRDEAQGLMILPDNFMSIHRALIIEQAARLKVPAIYPFRYFATDGGLMACGPDMFDLYRRTSVYVDRVLRGGKPADLPVQEPSKVDLVVNLRTAEALGLSVPRIVIARASEVIE